MNRLSDLWKKKKKMPGRPVASARAAGRAAVSAPASAPAPVTDSPSAPARSHRYDYEPPATTFFGVPKLEESEALVATRAGRPGLAAAVVLAVTAGLWWSNERFDAATGVGESRTVLLADGSQVQLDTDTAVDIDVGGRVRRVELARGGIYIETTPVAPRPLLIDTSVGQVRVHDGALSVRRDADGTVAVAVERGEAEVVGTALDAPAVLRAGDVLRFDRRLQSGVWHDEAPRALAWRRGELQFENEALGRVIDEVRRYDRRFWYGPAGEVAQTPLSTVVAFAHIDDWLDTLSLTLPLDIVRVGPVVWARERAAPVRLP